MSSKPIAFKKTRDEIETQPSAKRELLEKTFVSEIDKKISTQKVERSGKVTTVPLDEAATSILEKLSEKEERSERKIASRLLSAALKAEWEKWK